MNSRIEEFESTGFAIIREAIGPEDVNGLIESVESLTLNPKQVAGARRLTARLPSVAALAETPAIRGILERLDASGAFLVRSLFFDKQPGANWKVAWHQDLTIAVREQKEVTGFGPWSRKAGIPHVQPPVNVLQKMVTLRLHLDDCSAENGALKVLPGSHRHGVLNPAQIKQWRQKNTEQICEASKGGILAMRPLLLHASSESLLPSHRRVIHLEFASDELPSGLQWAK